MPVISPLKSFGVLRAVAGTGVGLGGGADSAIKLGPGVGVALAFAWLPEEGCMAPAKISLVVAQPRRWPINASVFSVLGK